MSSKKWQMQEAKARFAELVRRAGKEGPQVVTHRGVDTAVVLSMEEYTRLQPPKKSLVEYLMSGPKFDDETIDLINERSKDPPREIEF
jgi:prevent-host-death family protein